MTNKLLTLEEIEKIETSINQQNYSDDDVFNLAATARAYWETKKKEVHINCRQCGMSTFVDIEDTNNNKLDDKPHAPTIRAIEGYNQEKNAIASRMAIMSRSGQGEASYRLREIDKAIQSLVALNPSSKT